MFVKLSINKNKISIKTQSSFKFSYKKLSLFTFSNKLKNFLKKKFFPKLFLKNKH